MAGGGPLVTSRPGNRRLPLCWRPEQFGACESTLNHKDLLGVSMGLIFT